MQKRAWSDSQLTQIDISQVCHVLKFAWNGFDLVTTFVKEDILDWLVWVHICQLTVHAKEGMKWFTTYSNWCLSSLSCIEVRLEWIWFGYHLRKRKHIRLASVSSYLSIGCAYKRGHEVIHLLKSILLKFVIYWSSLGMDVIWLYATKKK